MKTTNTTRIQRSAVGLVLGTILFGGVSLHAQSVTGTEKLEQENAELKKRLDAMEEIMKKEGLEPSGDTSPKLVTALSTVVISGYVSSSYFYDLANSKDTAPDGYLWNSRLNSFTLNEIKLTLASPGVEKDKWDAAYRFSLLYGQDANRLDPQPVNGQIGFNPIREAYIELNVPVGTGLDVKAGELISLLNYESGDGGAVNDNFSQGYQWWYTGNGPSTGVQIGYDFSDKFGFKLRLQNGLFTGPMDVGAKTFLGGLYFKPDKKTSLALIGVVGQEDFASLGLTSYSLGAVSFIGSRKLTDWDNLSFATEVDYWRYSLPATSVMFNGVSKSSDFASFGGWLTGDLAPKTSWALRADFLYDPTGFATFYQSPDPNGSPGPLFFNGVAPHGQDLSSVTLTLDWKPAPNVKIQPEFRWNHSTIDTALNGKSDQFIAGCGVSYAF